MKSRSVAYVLKRFPRLSETFILNEILALEALGLRIRIISLHGSDSKVFHQQTKFVRAPIHYFPESVWGELPSMLRAQAHFLRRYPGRWIRSFNAMFWRHSLKAVRLWLQAGITAQLLEETDVGHIHAHFSTQPTAVAMMTGYFLDLRFSFTCHAKDVYADGRLSSPGFFRNLNRASFVVCGSARTKQDIVQAWPSLPAEKIYVIYNGLDLERFRWRSARPSDGLILAVGRLVEKKGLSYLVEACHLLKGQSLPFSCEIIGYANMANPNERLIRKNLIDLIHALELTDRVKLIGPFAQQELIAHYQRAAVFCLPAVVANNDDRDILPNVLKEAMAVGLPVVTTNIPGMQELVEDGRTGLLVEQRNPEVLAAALERLLIDQDLGERLADSGRQIIENRFDRGKNSALLLSLFEKYLNFKS